MGTVLCGCSRTTVFRIRDLEMLSVQSLPCVKPIVLTLVVVQLLAMYWYIPYVTISKDNKNVDEGERCFWAIFSTVIGVCLMIGADAQKYTQLKYKKGLVSEGFFERTRNPNYLGEIMIYGGFGIMAGDNICWGILFLVWTVLFGTGILRKELSYMKKDGWAAYKQHSLILLPRLFANYWLNYLFYITLAFISRLIYNNGGISTLLGLNK